MVCNESSVTALLQRNSDILVQIHLNALFFLVQSKLGLLHVFYDAVLRNKLLRFGLVERLRGF